MRVQGKISKWFDDKGYGFVTLDNDGAQAFAHISAFPKNSTRPLVGEVITFEIAKDEKKGLQAYNVTYKNRAISTYKNSKKKHSNYNLLGMLGLIFFVVFVWKQLSSSSNEVITPVEEISNQNLTVISSKNAFQCAGKTRCSQMISCAEASFYLQNCPGTISDGDNDGIPCEDQWCDH